MIPLLIRFVKRFLLGCMVSSTFFSFFLACGEVNNSNFSRDVCRKRIVGGQNAFKGAYPWHVLLTRAGKVACGGSLLNEQWVLTGQLRIPRPDNFNAVVVASFVTQQVSNGASNTF